MTTAPVSAASALRAVHHVGVSVADLERSIAFWEALLATPPRNRQLLDGPMVGVLVGYDGVRIDSCWFDLPGGTALELLQYLGRPEAPYAEGTAHPGNVHICLEVEDMARAHAHAVACGARPVSAEPIRVARGPRAGTEVAYLRNPDGVTIELNRPAAPP